MSGFWKDPLLHGISMHGVEFSYGLPPSWILDSRLLRGLPFPPRLVVVFPPGFPAFSAGRRSSWSFRKAPQPSGPRGCA